MDCSPSQHAIVPASLRTCPCRSSLLSPDVVDTRRDHSRRKLIPCRIFPRVFPPTLISLHSSPPYGQALSGGWAIALRTAIRAKFVWVSLLVQFSSPQAAALVATCAALVCLCPFLPDRARARQKLLAKGSSEQLPV